MLPPSLARRLVNHVRPGTWTESYAADWAMAQLRDAAWRMADRTDEFILAPETFPGSAAPCAFPAARQVRSNRMSAARRRAPVLRSLRVCRRLTTSP